MINERCCLGALAPALVVPEVSMDFRRADNNSSTLVDPGVGSVNAGPKEGSTIQTSCSTSGRSVMLTYIHDCSSVHERLFMGSTVNMVEKQREMTIFLERLEKNL